MTKPQSNRWSVLIALVGAVCIASAVAWAIFEGYSSDAELREGNIVPAALLGAAGLVLLVSGLIMRVRGSRNAPRPSK